MYRDVTTQADLEMVLQEPGIIPRCIGTGRFVVSGHAHLLASDSAHVLASGQAHVLASGNARIEARENAHVEVWDSAHVVAWDSAYLEPSGRMHVIASNGAHVEAVSYVSISCMSDFSGDARGGIIIRLPKLQTAIQWCDFHGVSVADGIVTLYKAVRDDYRSLRGMIYAPGTTPEAPDWDGGTAECGGGLHFCARPLEALTFDRNKATRFVACPVRIDEITLHYPAEYPNKVKAARVCAPIWEVDRYGTPLSASDSNTEG